MSNAETLASQLPPYLKEDRKAGFLAALKAFPDCKPLFTKIKDPEPLQGDCWDNVLFLRFPSGEQRRARAILLTNSCDASAENLRFNPGQLAFAPLVSLQKYRDLLCRNYDVDRVDAHISDIRAQRYTSMFYLPESGPLGIESIAILDQIQSIPLDFFVNDPDSVRVASLSDIGFYLFMFKLSFHFCRLHEDIDRTPEEGLAH